MDCWKSWPAMRLGHRNDGLDDSLCPQIDSNDRRKVFQAGQDIWDQPANKEKTMIEPVLTCPECGSDRVTTEHHQMFMVNGGDHYCHAGEATGR